MAETPYQTYDLLAHEFYDPVKHPTCANFREASGIFLTRHRDAYLQSGQTLCEIGAGRSLLAEILTSLRRGPDTLLLADSSPEMLAYSLPWRRQGAKLLLADAYALPFRSESLDALVASLGDAFNEAGFWKEAARVLRPGGNLLFTAPSYEWASTFRTTANAWNLASAEFLLANGAQVRVPSYILPEDVQTHTIQAHTLTVRHIDRVRLMDLTSPHISAKLRFLPEVHSPIVTGYIITKGK